MPRRIHPGRRLNPSASRGDTLAETETKPEVPPFLYEVKSTPLPGTSDSVWLTSS